MFDFSNLLVSKTLNARPLYAIIIAKFICVALASCKKDEVIYPPGTMLITITDTDIARFSLSGVGTATIDWGDGSEDETIEFMYDFERNLYHKYSERGSRTIKINGDYVTLLKCEYVTALDVSRNNVLKHLVCSSSILKELDLSKNTALKKLSCSFCQLKSLDVHKNTALTELNCNSTKLSRLDLSKNTALTELSCDGCQLSSLDVSKNTALIHLDCSFNKLTSLDVSNNTALQILTCTSNQIKSLNVNKNSALISLSCGNNQLTSLDVSMNTELIYLGCGLNQLSAEALNTLFGTLHSNPIPGKNITIRNNPGSDTCNFSIAAEKGWKLTPEWNP